MTGNMNFKKLLKIIEEKRDRFLRFDSDGSVEKQLNYLEKNYDEKIYSSIPDYEYGSLDKKKILENKKKLINNLVKILFKNILKKNTAGDVDFEKCLNLIHRFEEYMGMLIYTEDIYTKVSSLGSVSWENRSYVMMFTPGGIKECIRNIINEHKELKEKYFDEVEKFRTKLENIRILLPSDFKKFDIDDDEINYNPDEWKKELKGMSNGVSSIFITKLFFYRKLFSKLGEIGKENLKKVVDDFNTYITDFNNYEDYFKEIPYDFNEENFEASLSYRVDVNIKENIYKTSVFLIKFLEQFEELNISEDLEEKYDTSFLEKVSIGGRNNINIINQGLSVIKKIEERILEADSYEKVVELIKEYKPLKKKEEMSFKFYSEILGNKIGNVEKGAAGIGEEIAELYKKAFGIKVDENFVKENISDGFKIFEQELAGKDFDIDELKKENYESFKKILLFDFNDFRKTELINDFLEEDIDVSDYNILKPLLNECMNQISNKYKLDIREYKEFEESFNFFLKNYEIYNLLINKLLYEKPDDYPQDFSKFSNAVENSKNFYEERVETIKEKLSFLKKITEDEKIEEYSEKKFEWKYEDLEKFVEIKKYLDDINVERELKSFLKNYELPYSIEFTKKLEDFSEKIKEFTDYNNYWKNNVDNEEWKNLINQIKGLGTLHKDFINELKEKYKKIYGEELDEIKKDVSLSEFFGRVKELEEGFEPEDFKKLKFFARIKGITDGDMDVFKERLDEAGLSESVKKKIFSMLNRFFKNYKPDNEKCVNHFLLHGIPLLIFIRDGDYGDINKFLKRASLENYESFVEKAKKRFKKEMEEKELIDKDAVKELLDSKVLKVEA